MQNGKVTAFNIIALTKVWQTLYDEYLLAFGIGEHYKEIIEKEREISLLKIDRYLQNEKSMETLIDIAELELAEMKGIKGGNFLETKSIIEKVLSFQIDMKKTSVAEYYTYLGLAVEQGKSKQNG